MNDLAQDDEDITQPSAQEARRQVVKQPYMGSKVAYWFPSFKLAKRITSHQASCNRWKNHYHHA